MGVGLRMRWVGLSAVMIASAMGARVIAVDRSPAALELASEFGAECVLEAEGDTSRRVVELTDGGAHVSLDAVGSTDTSIASVRSLRPRGRHIQIGLLLGADSTPPLPMGEVIAKELEIYGSHGMPAHDYPGMLELVASGTLRPDRLVGERIELSEAAEALADMSAPSAGHGVTVIEMP